MSSIHLKHRRVTAFLAFSRISANGVGDLMQPRIIHIALSLDCRPQRTLSACLITSVQVADGSSLLSLYCVTIHECVGRKVYARASSPFMESLRDFPFVQKGDSGIGSGLIIRLLHPFRVSVTTMSKASKFDGTGLKLVFCIERTLRKVVQAS